MDFEQFEQEHEEKRRKEEAACGNGWRVMDPAAGAHLLPECSYPPIACSMEPRWFNPIYLDAPHTVTDYQKVENLTMSMMGLGWRGEPLVGYTLDGRIQLLSGTHRRAAAIRVGIRVPVIVNSYEKIWQAYGDVTKWKELMRFPEGE